MSALTNFFERIDHEIKLRIGQSMRQIMPDRVLLPQYFRDHGQAPPASVSDGNPFTVFFINQTENEVALHWVDLEGNLKAFGTIEPGKLANLVVVEGDLFSPVTPSASS